MRDVKREDDNYDKLSKIRDMSISAVVIAVGLIFMSIRCGSFGLPVWKSFFSIYGVGLDIGFRWSTILGMIGVMLIQLVMYVVIHCRKEWKLYIIAFGYWMDSLILNFRIRNNTFNYIKFKLEEYGYREIDLFYAKHDITMLALAVVILNALFFSYRLLMFTSKIDSRKAGSRSGRLAWHIFSAVMTVSGLAVLILQSFTSPWYIILCLVSATVSVKLLSSCKELLNRFFSIVCDIL